MEASTRRQQVWNYLSVPSLRQLSITKVVTLLWKQFDLKEAKEEYLSTVHVAFRDLPSSRNKTLFNVDSRVSKNLSSLLLPLMLKQDASHVIRPIGLQMLEWIDKHMDSYPAQNCTEFHWTPQGTVDKQKTAESLFEKYLIASQRRVNKPICQIGVSNMNYQIFLYRCYEMACEYCCEEYIPKLWAITSVRDKLSFRRNIYSYTGDDKSLLLIYWTYKLDGGNLEKTIKDYNMDSSWLNGIWLNNGFYQCRSVESWCELLTNKLQSKNMFEWAIFNSNNTAVRYFWHHLTKEEITKNIIAWTKNVIRIRKYDDYRYQYANNNTDVFCFLLSQMNKNQQRHVFKKYHNAILYALFIDWPWQTHVLPTVDLMWKFLDGQNYTQLLSKISCKLNINNSVSEILRELWKKSPLTLRNYFIQNIEYNGGMDVLTRLLKIEDINTIKLILTNATAEEKRQILCSSQVLSECRQIILKHKWNLFQVFVEQILSSEDDLIVFKKTLVKLKAGYLCWTLINNADWQLLDRFLGWCFSSKDEIRRFKKELLYKNCRNICCVLLKKLVEKNELELVQIDKYMHWSLSTDKEVQKFKKDLAYREMKYLDVLVASILVCQKEELAIMKEFLNWTFSSEEKVNQFKLEILRIKKRAKYICKKLLLENKLELADVFLKWCYTSVHAVNQCKNEIMFSKMEILDILNCHHRHEDQREQEEHKQKIAEWFIHNSFVKCKTFIQKHLSETEQNCNNPSTSKCSTEKQ